MRAKSISLRLRVVLSGPVALTQWVHTSGRGTERPHGLEGNQSGCSHSIGEEARCSSQYPLKNALSSVFSPTWSLTALTGQARRKEWYS